MAGTGRIEEAEGTTSEAPRRVATAVQMNQEKYFKEVLQTSQTQNAACRLRKSAGPAE